MKYKFCILFLLLCLLPVSGKDEMKISKYSRVYTGDEGVKVIVVKIESSTKEGEYKEALIKILGVDHPWDGKIFLHNINEYNDKIDYVMQLDGKDYVTLFGRNSAWGGGKNYFLCLNNTSNDIPVYYSEEESKKINPEDI